MMPDPTDILNRLHIVEDAIRKEQPIGVILLYVKKGADGPVIGAWGPEAVVDQLAGEVPELMALLKRVAPRSPNPFAAEKKPGV